MRVAILQQNEVGQNPASEQDAAESVQKSAWGNQPWEQVSDTYMGANVRHA